MRAVLSTNATSLIEAVHSTWTRSRLFVNLVPSPRSAWNSLLSVDGMRRSTPIVASVKLA